MDVAGSALFAAGLMPGAAAGFGASGAWITPFRTSVELGAFHFPFGQRPTDAGTAEFRATYGELRACPRLWNAVVAVDACGAFRGGVLSAEGRGFPVEDFDTSRFYAAVGAAARARVPVTRALFLRFGAELSVPLVRDRFVVSVASRSVELHTVSAVVATFDAAVGLTL